jgi:Type I restriction modification DNA specificity domain
MAVLGGLGSCGGTPLELAYGSNQTINGWAIQAAEYSTTFCHLTVTLRNLVIEKLRCLRGAPVHVLIVSAGDYVVSSSGTIGRVAEVHEEDLPCMLNTSVIRMRPASDALDRRFLLYFLKSALFQDQIRSFASGSAQINYGPSHLRKMTVMVPPRAEQARLIGEFMEIENAQEALTAERSALTTLRSTISQVIFGDAS